MKQSILLSLQQLKKNNLIDANLIDQFITFIETNAYTKNKNPAHHLCSFFVPFHKKTQSIYMGHHVKANYWIPPGGHVDPEETPHDAALRELKEELKYVIRPNQMIFFDLSIHSIDDPKRVCQTHYDFWYYFLSPKIEFHFDRGEFYDARWIHLNDALTLTKSKNVKRIVSKLKQI